MARGPGRAKAARAGVSLSWGNMADALTEEFMSTPLLRVVERAQQDAEQGPEAIQSNGLRMVSAPPTPTGRGPARSAHETLGRTLQLLRSERPPSKSGPSGSRHATGLAQMAAPSQPAYASHVGAVQPIVGTLPASPAAGCRADMGGVATRHISGGAGWWKSPCPVLERASGEQSPGATRPRHNIIDRIIHDVLGWPRNQVDCEHYIDPGYADYLLRKPSGDPLLIIEAKREGDYFELPATFSEHGQSRYIAVKTLLTNKNIRDAMEQLVSYCTAEGCEYACVSNGHTWIFFKAFERGKPWRSLKAYVIQALDYFCISYTDSANKFGYRSIVERASLPALLSPDQIHRRAMFFPKERIVAYDEKVTQNRFASRLRPIIERYFGVIRDQDSDFMSSCYVNIREYDRTHRGVYALIRDSLSPYFKKQDVKDFDDDDSGGLFGRTLVKNLQRERKNQVIVLFGGKGSGKSTFLRRLLLHRSPKYLDKRAVTVIVDLLETPDDADTITNEIWEQTISNLDRNHLLREDRSRLLMLFKDRFKIAKRQVLAGLSEDSEAYNIRLNEILATWLRDRKYCAQQLALDWKRQHKGIVLALDNTDQFSYEMQDLCFSVARELSVTLNCLVIISMREERYYSSKIHGILDAFAIAGFHISSPFPELVFQRRVDYVRQLLSRKTKYEEIIGETPSALLRDFRRFFKIFNETFRTSDSPLNRFLAASAHGNIRLALDLFKGFMLSGYTNVDEMTSRASWTIATHQAIKPMMIPDRFFYDESRSYIPNLFQIRSKRNGSHFTSSRILKMLSDGQSITNPLFVPTTTLRDYFLYNFDMLEDYEDNLDILLRYGLVEANNRLDEFSINVDAVRITNFGAYMAGELVYYFAYLDLVCIDCAIFDESIANSVAVTANEDYRLFRKFEKLERVHHRLDRVQVFLQYLHDEEEREAGTYMPLGLGEMFSNTALGKFREERPRILRSAKSNSLKRPKNVSD